MAKLRVGNIDPQSGTNLTLGTTGDSVTVSSTELRVNTFKDAGGNTLWTSNGSGSLSSINSSLAGGGLVLLNTQTASGSSTVEITQNIDSTYDEYIVVVTNWHTSSDNVWLRFQAGSGYNSNTSTTFWKAHQNPTGNGSASSDSTVNGFGTTSKIRIMQGQSNSTAETMGGIFHIFQPSRTDIYKKWFWETIGIYETPGVVSNYLGGIFNSNNAIDSIEFSQSGGNIDGGTFQLFGVG